MPKGEKLGSGKININGKWYFRERREIKIEYNVGYGKISLKYLESYRSKKRIVIQIGRKKNPVNICWRNAPVLKVKS